MASSEDITPLPPSITRRSRIFSGAFSMRATRTLTLFRTNPSFFRAQADRRRKSPRSRMRARRRDFRDRASRRGPRASGGGVDVSETMILEARRRAAALDLAVGFEVGDAQALRFDDGAFDACRTERMLMDVPDAERAFAEMARVVCRGGRLRCSISTGKLDRRQPLRGYNPPNHAFFLRQLQERLDRSSAPRLSSRRYDGRNRHASTIIISLPVPGASARRASPPRAESRRCVSGGGGTLVGPSARGAPNRNVL